MPALQRLMCALLLTATASAGCDSSTDDASSTDASVTSSATTARDASTSTRDAAADLDAAAASDVDAAVPLPVDCDVEAPTACPDPMPTFVDIQPIIEKRCVPCHYGMEGGPWPLTSYMHVADWYDIIRGAMLNCTMPPAEAPSKITTEERVKILEWLRCGHPR